MHPPRVRRQHVREHPVRPVRRIARPTQTHEPRSGRFGIAETAPPTTAARSRVVGHAGVRPRPQIRPQPEPARTVRDQHLNRRSRPDVRIRRVSTRSTPPGPQSRRDRPPRRSTGPPGQRRPPPRTTGPAGASSDGPSEPPRDRHVFEPTGTSGSAHAAVLAAPRRVRALPSVATAPHSSPPSSTSAASARASRRAPVEHRATATRNPSRSTTSRSACARSWASCASLRGSRPRRCRSESASLSNDVTCSATFDRVGGVERGVAQVLLEQDATAPPHTPTRSAPRDTGVGRHGRRRDRRVAHEQQARADAPTRHRAAARGLVASLERRPHVAPRRATHTLPSMYTVPASPVRHATHIAWLTYPRWLRRSRGRLPRVHCVVLSLHCIQPRWNRSPSVQLRSSRSAPVSRCLPASSAAS